MALDSNAASLKFGSYYGGPQSQEHVDGGTSRFDPRGVIYQSVCAGCGAYDDFPISPGAWPCGFITPCPPGPNLSTNCNNGVFKVDFQLQVAVAAILSNTFQGCAPLTVSFTNAVSSPTFVWYFGNGQTNSVNPNPVVTYTAPGTYTVALTVINPTTCNVKDSTYIEITVLPKPNASFMMNYTPCVNPAVVQFSNNSTGPPPLSYSWNFGDGSPTSTLTNPSHTYTANGVYTVQLTTTHTNGCASTLSQTLHVFSPTVSAAGGTACA
ncbi:MAG: PKD domain-containing protein, partial [Bacteroidia bacterium]|nr:PKD domain-containing protein [Bacteroidia bacterium]